MYQLVVVFIAFRAISFGCDPMDLVNEWGLREIVEGDGEGSICEAGFVDGLSDADLEAMFRSARDVEYSAIAEEARELTVALPAQGQKLESIIICGSERSALADQLRFADRWSESF